MATSEYCSCPPRVPTPTASHVAIASGVNHRVTSPRWTSARSYAGQFPTRYFVVYLGCTLDFTSRSCPFGRHDDQGRDEHLFPRTNACCRGRRTILLMKSRVPPKYKTPYRVGNGREYERALVQRGDVTRWLSADATDAWRPSPSGRPGGQKRCSDVASRPRGSSGSSLARPCARRRGSCGRSWP